MQKIKILKIKIRSAQNVGKVWISRKNPPGPIWGPLGSFFAWAAKYKKCKIFVYFPWWAHGPYSPGLGPLLLFALGGDVYMLPVGSSE